MSILERPSVNIAVAFGRFNGPSVEHGKLIDLVFAQQSHYHLIFVGGPSDETKVTLKDPLTAFEKTEILRTLYPSRASCFVVADTPETRSIPQALAAIYRMAEYYSIDLTVVAGQGMNGVTNDTGGSIDEFKDIVQRLNNTRYADGNTRFNFERVTYVSQQRGNISGSIIRAFANSSTDVKSFKRMLHPTLTYQQAKEIMETIKRRTSMLEMYLGKSVKLTDPTTPQRDKKIKKLQTLQHMGNDLSDDEIKQRIAEIINHIDPAIQTLSEISRFPITFLRSAASQFVSDNLVSETEVETATLKHLGKCVTGRFFLPVNEGETWKEFKSA